jgi:AraC-like DNA-binding protein
MKIFFFFFFSFFSLTLSSKSTIVFAFPESKSNTEKNKSISNITVSKFNQGTQESSYTKWALSSNINQPEINLTVEINMPIIEYIDQAAIYLDEFEFKKALKTALLAYKLAKEKGDVELEVFSLLLVAQINMYWDNPEVSSLIYVKIEEYRHTLNESLSKNLYLVTQLGQSSVFLKLNEPDKALSIIEEVFSSDQNNKKTFLYQEFLWNSGIAYFQKKKFHQAFDSLNKVVALAPSIYNKALLNYYKGSYYEQTESIVDALPFYKGVDSLITGQNVIIPEVREIYTTINNYYLERGDRVSQFDYLNKFLKTLTIHNDISDYVKNTTREQFEIPLLIEAKQQEIKRLKEQEKQNRKFTILIFCSLFILLSFSVYYLVKQRSYKKRFEKLVHKNLITSKAKVSELQNQNISLEVVENLMKKLEEFEENKQYLSKDISLNAIAKQFETNSSYLSKVVNLKKDKNFSNYINDLRIEHCIEKLHTHKQLRNYTIKAIAEEMGYNNAQSFSSAFYKYAGIYPSFFIEQLIKSEKKIT